MISSLVVMLCVLLTACGSNKSTEKVSSQPTKEETNTETVTAKKKVIFFGNSLTAGYGLDPDEAFPSLINQKFETMGLPYESINAGLSGETTAGGKERVEWILENYEPAIFILELGGNDGLRGIDPKASEANLQAIIDKVKKQFPKTIIILAGMQAPPNMGEAYTSSFSQIYPTLAKRNNIPLVPFLLEGVAGIPELNQGDGIHPTAEGNKIVAENVWSILKKQIRQET
ncbi:arylesterase [Limibacter armeniacum]|uniref:arylesterase n=1 Tax=Limibacter armeniacum TaxID=466084 RepID=UPI002FE6C053